jgi:A/G-specific adenine glycosylase
MTSRIVAITLPSKRSGATSLAEPLMKWFEPRRHAYPWRGTSDPYAVLVSEIMLQQTQAARVVPAFERFLGRFPTVAALAHASRADVVRAWEGLGYNRRAVALSEAARAIVRDHGGRVPGDPEELKLLPGVGPYTAAAIASFAYGAAIAAVDTNVRRVVARARFGRESADVRPRVIDDEAERWLDRRHPAEWNQALMDLGRQICRPEPRCEACPIAADCRARSRSRRSRIAPRRAAPFEGSMRQARGGIVRVLRRRGASVGELAAQTGFPVERIVDAVGALVRDGLLVADTAARAGRATGRVRLAD